MTDPKTITDGMDLLAGTGVVGGIVAVITTFGWWLRRERVEASKANNTVAANNATTNTYAAQSAEIAAVRERLSQMESAYISQSVQINELLKKISEMEAKLIGAAAHHDNLILCKICIGKNERVLEALEKTLGKINNG